MSVQVDAGIVVAVIAMMGTLASAYIANGKESKTDAAKRYAEAVIQEHRMTILESKIEPIWETIMNEIPKLLIKESTPELDILLRKTQNGSLDDLSFDELYRLKRLLEIEFDKIRNNETDSARSRGIGLAFFKAAVKSTIISKGLNKC